MSAFQLSPTHIAYMLGIAQAVHPEYGITIGHVSPFDADTAFALLWRENTYSVEYRYGEEPDTMIPECPSIPVVRLRSVVDIAEAIKAVDCYAYQSCEHPTYAGSDVDRFCDALIRACTRQIPGFMFAYREAPWAR